MPLTSYFIKLNYGSFLFTLLFKISAHCSGQVSQEPEIENFHSDIHSEENFSETGEGAPIPLSDEELSQLLFGDLSEMPTEEITISETKVWLHSISASMGLGYSDNPMFGPYTRKSSGFVELGTEDEPVDYVEPILGHSLLPLLSTESNPWEHQVFAEYSAEGTYAPCLRVRKGKFKYVYCETDPALLFDLEAEPSELNNLAGNETYAEVLSGEHAPRLCSSLT